MAKAQRKAGAEGQGNGPKAPAADDGDDADDSDYSEAIGSGDSDDSDDDEDDSDDGSVNEDLSIETIVDDVDAYEYFKQTLAGELTSSCP